MQKKKKKEENNRRGKTRDLFQKIENIKDGKLEIPKVSTIKDRNGKDLIETEEVRRDGKNTQKNCTKRDLNHLDNHNGVVTYPEPDLLKCEVY